MLSWHVTGLWYPGETSVAYYGRISDPEQGLVAIPRNDARRAEVTVRTTDKVLRNVMGVPYARCLRAYYYDRLVFWGPISLHSVDMRLGTVKLNAVDPALRLIFHQVRRGDLDGAMSAPDDKASVTADYEGLRLLRDAGLNTAGQTTRGVPDLGIADGTNTADATPDELIAVTRGDQVFNSMLDVVNSGNTDFALIPTEDTEGAYCELWTRNADSYADLSSAGIGFHFGTGLQNLENLRYTDGGRYITHAHVLPRDLTQRVTVANLSASAITGPYVQWDATDYDSDADPDKVANVLQAYGEQLLRAYSRPLIDVTLELPEETAGSFRYLDHYDIGNTVPVAGKSGEVTLEDGTWQIQQIRLKQAGPDNRVKPELDVVSDRVTALEDEITGTEDD